MRSLLGALLVQVLIVGSAQAQPSGLVFDDAFLAINLDNSVRSQGGNQPAEVKYRPQFRLRFFGASDGDAVKIKWKQGRRVLAEIRCPLDERSEDFRTVFSNRCWNRDEVALEAYGDIQAEIIFVDDSEESEHSIRTLTVPVGRYWRVDRSGNPTVHSVRYQVRHDDALGFSYIYLQAPEDTEPFGNVYLYTWAALANDRSNYRDPSWRCSINGERQEELNINDDSVIESIVDVRVDDDQVRARNQRSSEHYAWRLMWIKPRWIWGSTRNANASDLTSSNRFNISQHPGEYVCKLRNEGEMVRELRFTVNAQGTIDMHPVQSDGDLSLRQNAFFIETRFPERNPAETFFNRDAIRRGLLFGRSWPNNPRVRAFLNALPASFGRSEPEVPRDRRGRRRRGR